jgi:hypothetical protein
MISEAVLKRDLFTEASIKSDSVRACMCVYDCMGISTSLFVCHI